MKTQQTNMIEIDLSGEIYKVRKKPSELDDFVLRFVSVLDEIGLKYVIISGYVSILFGRSRLSEDVDIIIEKMDKNKFSDFWAKITKEFDDILTDGIEDAYEHIETGHALRFSDRGRFIPNMEIKTPKNEIDKWVIENRIPVNLNGKEIFISKIELQISFKLFLGSEKDIEDAKHLYNLFKERLDKNMFESFLKKLDNKNNFKRFLL